MPAVLENDMPRLTLPSIPGTFVVRPYGDASSVLAHACPLEKLKTTQWGQQVQEAFGWDNFALAGIDPPAQVYAMRVTRQAQHERGLLELSPGMLYQIHLAPRKTRRSKRRGGRKRAQGPPQTSAEVKTIIVTDMTLRQDSTCAWVTVMELDDDDPIIAE